ncbi:MAG TPA: hypothetical protein VLK36_08935 [Gaiellaceae bacterium]|nr:hypothetical protein [Gaiellaceae bacterium]
MALKTLLLGTRDTIAGTVYGTIVVLSVVTAGAPAFEHGEWNLVVIGAVTVLVFWLAHVYAHILGESLHHGHRLTRGEVLTVARRELAIPLAAVLPMGAVALGALGVLGNTLALWIAVAIGVATLTIEGIRYARLENLSRGGTLVSVGVNLAFGMALVVLKATLSH